MMQLRQYAQLPSIVPTLIDDRISVIVPVARTNEILNPSGETNTTGYTAGAGTLARTTAEQYHGAYSFIYTPSSAVNDGCYYTITTTLATRAIACKFKGDAGLSYTFSIASTTPLDLQSKTFTASGRWQWIWFYFLDTSATTRRIYWKKNNSANVRPFYFDGVQSEIIGAGETVSTYIDGDQLGLVPNQSPPAFFWNGTPHASTSTRSALTRAGGMVISFKSFGFFLTAIIGLGLATPQNAATEYARIDGGYDDFTRKPTRQFTIQGNFESRGDYLSLRQQRGGLARLLDRDLIAQDQRLILLRDVVDECDQPCATTARLLGKYQGGLEGNTDNHLASVAPITFTQYLGVVLSDGESGGALNVQTSVNSSNYINRRSPAGVWSAMGSGGAGGPFTVGTTAIVVGLDGTVYASGYWTSMGGVANTAKIARWDTSAQAWSAMGTGATGGDVFTLFVAADGTIYAGGSFTAMGGVANTAKIAKWNPTTLVWSSVTGAGAANGDVNAIVQARDSHFYIGGNFTSIGGTAANRIVKYNGVATWTAMGTGAATSVFALAVAPNGTDVYAGGAFAAMGGVANTGRIARWNGSAWLALSSGLPTGGSEFVAALTFGANAILYLTGQFATAGGVSADNIASWNGVSFQPLGAGLAYSPAAVNEQGGTLLATPSGLYVGGLFDQAGTITLPDSMAVWQGGGFTPIDIDLVGGALVTALEIGPDGTLYVGHNSTGTATAASTTTITNTGTARSYPTITLSGPSSGTARLYSIINTTTNRALYFSLVLNAGETARLVLQPDQLSFTSTFQGDISSTIQQGSNTADFFLQPGANTIAFLSASSTVTATLSFRPSYVSIDDVP